MDFAAVEKHYGIRFRPGSELIDGLESEIKRYEASYGVSSSTMHKAIADGRRTETEALSRWMQSYMVLSHLQNGNGHKQTRTTGTATKTT